MSTLIRRLLRQRTNTSIMLTSLSISFAFMIAITCYVRQELSYDHFWTNFDSIYRLQTTYTYPGSAPFSNAQSPLPLSDLMVKNFSEIDSAARIELFTELSLGYQTNLVKDSVVFVDPSFFELFTIDLITGSKEPVLAHKSSILISETLAERLYGSKIAQGQTLTAAGEDDVIDYRVAGIFKDLPDNTHFKFSAIALLDSDDHWGNNNWKAPQVFTYIRVKDEVTADAIEKALPALQAKNIPFSGSIDVASALEITLYPLADLHLFQDSSDDFKKSGSIITVTIYSLSAAFLMLAAGANFINILFIQASFRLKEIAIRSVFGANWHHIFGQFLPETFAIFSIAFLLALVGIDLFGDSIFELMGYRTPEYNQDFLISVGLVAVLGSALALLAGVIPAVVIAKSQPLLSLRTRNASLRTTLRFGRWLIGFQFFVAISTTIVANVITAQITFMQEKDLGFDYSDIYVIFNAPLEPPLSTELLEGLRALPGVIGVSRSMSMPAGVGLPDAHFLWTKDGSEFQSDFSVHSVDTNHFPLFKRTMLAGRTLSEANPNDFFDRQKSNINIVANESLVRLLGYTELSQALSQQIWWEDSRTQFFTIVGVVKDAHYSSMREKIPPTVYLNNEDHFFSLGVKIHPERHADTLKNIRELWNDTVPNKVFAGEFLVDSIQALYAPEYQLVQFLNVASFVSIALSALGLYSATAFLLGKRLKEFAIRKVLGASTSRLFRLAIWGAIQPAIFASFLACPISYLYLSNWLTEFAYRLAMPIPLYLFSSLALILVALLSVCVIAFKVAKSPMAPILAEE